MTRKCMSLTSLRTLMLFLLLALFILIAGCESGLDGEYSAIEEEKQITDGKDEENMRSEQNFPELAMPPIDQEVPENLETATLALG